MNPLPVTDADLNAYVDGQLAASRVAAVEEALARDPAMAAQVADAKRHNADLRDALDPWLADPIPERLLAAAARQPAAARRPVRRWLVPAAAVAASLAVGLGTGWYTRDIELEREGTPTTFTRQAALTHALYAADVNRPVEVWAPEEKRLVDMAVQAAGIRCRRARSQQHGLRAGRRAAGRRPRESHRAVHVRERGQAAAVAAGAQAAGGRWRGRRSGTPSKMASASSTGSTTTAATRCPATSTARSCWRSAASSTDSWRRSRLPASRNARSTTPRGGSGART